MKNEIYDISKRYLEEIGFILPALEREILLEFTRYVSQKRNKNNPPLIVFNGGAILANLNGPELFGISYLSLSSGKWKYTPDYFTNEITLPVLKDLETPIISYTNIPSLGKLIELGKDYTIKSLSKLFSGITMTKEEFLKISKVSILNFPISDHSSLDDGIKFHHVVEVGGNGREFEVKLELLKNRELRYIRLPDINPISFAEKLIEIYEEG